MQRINCADGLDKDITKRDRVSSLVRVKNLNHCLQQSSHNHPITAELPLKSFLSR